jgi:uncharacterized membrane protein
MGEMMGGMAGQMMNGGMTGGGWIWGGMVWFGLLALALIVAIGLAIVVLVGRRSTGPAADDPREIVRRRFARGELSTEAFAEAMKTLG